MLLKIREKSKGIVAYVIIGLIAITFSLWGMDSLFTALRGDPNEAVKVNGEVITNSMIDRYAQQQMQQLIQSGRASPEQIDIGQLRQFVMGQLVQQSLLRQEAAAQRLRVTDREVEREMVSLEVFRGADGRFDAALFRSFLARQGLSATAFREQIRNDLVTEQLLNGFAATEFVLVPEVNEVQALLAQTRSYRFTRFRAADYLERVVVDEQAVADYYQANQVQFMAPARIQVDYILFDPQTLVADIEITDAELQQAYQQFADNLQQQANTSFAHIMLTYTDDDSKAQALQTLQAARADLLAGADFAALAAELSEDAATSEQGGYLGPISAGALDPQFETAAFALQNPGDISEPVESAYGLHLIQLVERDVPEIPPLEAVAERLREQLLVQPLRAATSDKLELLNNLAFSAQNLDEVAAEAGLEKQTSDWLVDGQLEDFWAESTVSNLLFSAELTEENWITEPQRLADGRYLLLSRKAYEAAHQQSLDEVAEQVRVLLQQSLASSQAHESALAVRHSLLAGEAVADIDWQTVDHATRGIRQAESSAQAAAFRMGLQGEDAVSLVPQPNGDLLLVQLLAIGEGDLAATDAEGLRLTLTEEQTYRMQARLISHLERRAAIEIR